MLEHRFRVVVSMLGLAFAAFFCVVVVPPLLRSMDPWAALAAGFVNPYASGYAADTITCWLVLATWVAYEAKARKVRHGWIALVLGLAPGVATGLAFYLLLRSTTDTLDKMHDDKTI